MNDPVNPIPNPVPTWPSDPLTYHLADRMREVPGHSSILYDPLHDNFFHKLTMVGQGTLFYRENIHKVRETLPDKHEALYLGIEAAVNSHGLEKESNTPDFITAAFLTRVFVAATQMINRRSLWRNDGKVPPESDAPPQGVVRSEDITSPSTTGQDTSTYLTLGPDGGRLQTNVPGASYANPRGLNISDYPEDRKPVIGLHLPSGGDMLEAQDASKIGPAQMTHTAETIADAMLAGVAARFRNDKSAADMKHWEELKNLLDLVHKMSPPGLMLKRTSQAAIDRFRELVAENMDLVAENKRTTSRLLDEVHKLTLQKQQIEASVALLNKSLDDLGHGNGECLRKRKIGEPMFIVLARDPVGPDTLRFWAKARELAINAGMIDNNRHEHAHVNNVRSIADDMDAWKRAGGAS